MLFLVVFTFDLSGFIIMAFPIGTLCKVAAVILLTVRCEGQRFGGLRVRSHGPRATGNQTVFEDRWFIQRLDHFNGADGRTWKQVSGAVSGGLLSGTSSHSDAWQWVEYLVGLCIWSLFGDPTQFI